MGINMKKKTESVVVKATLPGACKRVAAMISDKNARDSYIRMMIDAETTFQTMKRKQPKEKDE